MRTVDIVKGLLEIVERIERDVEFCSTCGKQEHKPDCEYVKITEAAKEYLKIMEGSNK